MAGPCLLLRVPRNSFDKAARPAERNIDAHFFCPYTKLKQFLVDHTDPRNLHFRAAFFPENETCRRILWLSSEVYTECHHHLCLPMRRPNRSAERAVLISVMSPPTL